MYRWQKALHLYVQKAIKGDFSSDRGWISKHWSWIQSIKVQSILPTPAQSHTQEKPTPVVAELLMQFGLTTKAGERGRLRLESLAKALDCRRVPAFLESIETAADMKDFSELSAWLAPDLSDMSKTSKLSHSNEGASIYFSYLLLT